MHLKDALARGSRSLWPLISTALHGLNNGVASLVAVNFSDASSDIHSIERPEGCITWSAHSIAVMFQKGILSLVPIGGPSDY